LLISSLHHTIILTKRRAWLILLTYLILSGGLFGQASNLVLNPSFEQKVDFQNNTPTTGWSKCLKNDTPDYIEFSARGKPEFYYRKYIGGLLPYDGNAYAGIFCYRTNPLRGIDNIREFIQAPLVQPLQKDTLYLVSLYVALDPESTTAINNFNVYFGKEPVALKKEKQMFVLHPQIRFRQMILDSLSWMRLETTYKARGQETQIILGNFSTDNSLRKKNVYHMSSMLEKWNMHELERAAYYYIDMVSVVKISDLPTTVPGSVEIVILDEIEPDPAPKPTFIDIEKVQPDTSVVLNNIFFEFDKAELLPASFMELDHLFEQLVSYSDLSIVIEGHTDNMGTFEYNMQLSLLRAQSVVKYLMDKGLSSDRIHFEGYGYTRPLSDNRTETGRQLNRRVAFRIKEIL